MKYTLTAFSSAPLIVTPKLGVTIMSIQVFTCSVNTGGSKSPSFVMLPLAVTSPYEKSRVQKTITAPMR